VRKLNNPNKIPVQIFIVDGKLYFVIQGGIPIKETLVLFGGLGGLIATIRSGDLVVLLTTLFG